MKRNTIIAKMDSKGRVTERKSAAERGDVFNEDAAVYETDTDNPSLSLEKLAGMKRVPRVKTLRRALQLTQEEFAAQYQIPIGTLRDWEQGRSEPDAPAKAYLRVIASEPNRVKDVLVRGRSKHSID
jgi:putative transcriptional regulator